MDFHRLTGSTPRDTLSPSQLRTLVAILAGIQFDGRVPSFKELAVELTGNPTNLNMVWECLNKLESMGLIERGGSGVKCRALRPKCRIEFFAESGLKTTQERAGT